jgi:hypothetical protein
MVTTDDGELQLCVEVAVTDGTWLEQLPPAPSTRPVTVSFDDVELAARDRTAVDDLGYTVVGTGAVGHAEDVAHLLVPLSAVEDHPRWWRAVLDLATRVYDLRFGPVQLALADVLRAHADHARTGSAATRPRPRAPGRPHPSA